jgi:hypothetical protein
MTSYTGPPMTLGNAAAARVRLIVWCKECGRRVEPDPAEQARRYGVEMAVPDCTSGLSAESAARTTSIWWSQEPNENRPRAARLALCVRRRTVFLLGAVRHERRRYCTVRVPSPRGAAPQITAGVPSGLDWLGGRWCNTPASVRLASVASRKKRADPWRKREDSAWPGDPKTCEPGAAGSAS